MGHDVIENRMAKPKSAQIDDMLVRKDVDWHPRNRITVPKMSTQPTNRCS